MPSRTRRSKPETRGGRTPGGHVLEMQRRRLLTAVVELGYEQGLAALTITTLCERAGLSRKTFYDVFEERDDCVHAAFLDAADQANCVVASAAEGHERWRDKVWAGLCGLLAFIDSEPASGRLLVVDALGAGERIATARACLLAQAIAAIDLGRTESKNPQKIPLLTAEGIAGAVFSVIHARVLLRDAHPLSELAGPLMAMIVGPYLGQAAAKRALSMPAPAAVPSVPRLPADPFKDLPMRFTYRTARVLSMVANTPGASSKQIAAAAGINDIGQASKLLSRLRRHELIEDTGLGPTKGKARAWRLTPRGQNVLQATGQT